MSVDAEAVFAASAAERRAVADLLESLDATQLATPSLCDQWDVKAVGAHLASAVSPQAGREFVRALVRSRGRLHRANADAALVAARRPVAELVADLRRYAESRSSPPVTGPRGPLVDVLVHAGDMRIPLGLEHCPPAGHARPGLELVASGRAVGFASPRRLRGLRFVAPDLGWSSGRGATVSGSSIDLLMALCGRRAVLPRLEGSGVELLRRRITG